MIADDEYLERIVAGIHAVTTIDADVVWNDKINGRQFDVSVRFRIGTLNYLVLIEVKNKSRRATASDLEAFVQKARDNGSNKSVFVTAAGFQSGAVDVAMRHKVDIFTVGFDRAEVRLPDNISIIQRQLRPLQEGEVPHFEVSEPMTAPTLTSLSFRYATGAIWEMPNEQSQMGYYLRKTMVGGVPIADLVGQRVPDEINLLEKRTDKVVFSAPRRLTPPDDYFFPGGYIVGFDITFEGVTARTISGNIGIDPGLFSSPVVYTNAITGEETKYSLNTLPLGNEAVVAGEFYFINHPLAYYVCAAIEGDLVRWHLIESFQNGERLSATYTQQRRYASGYIPVTDKMIRKRLQRRLEHYLKISNNPRPT